MSSNDQLLIRKIKNGNYEIHHNFCVDNDFKPNKNTLVKTEVSLVRAIKFAKKYANEEMVEYGYSIDDSCLGDKK